MATILSWFRDFNRANGRQVMRHEDIQPVAREYQRYKVIPSLVPLSHPCYSIMLLLFSTVISDSYLISVSALKSGIETAAEVKVVERGRERETFLYDDLS
jgi:uncharacterized protein YjaG (DUF416 family)